MKKLVLILSALSLVTGCNGADSDSGDKAQKDRNTVQVFKYQESVQCFVQSGIPLAEMAADLTDMNIEVICATEAHDGNPVAAACGISTGKINVYEIPQTALLQAENLGFKNVASLENANIEMDCE